MGIKSHRLQWVDPRLDLIIPMKLHLMVCVNGTPSKSRVMGCEVPQGRILGPLLFLFCVNDLRAVGSCNLFYMLTILFYWPHMKRQKWERNLKSK